MFFNFFKKKNLNIWEKLKDEKAEGFFVLAPMADVTDNPFRKLISEIGKPDLFFTEFVAVDGLVHPEARERLIKQILSFEKKQKPIIAQIFGGKPENYFQAAKLCSELGFDGIDINMGCPQRNILKQKAGSELIKEENRELVKKIISEAGRGIEASGKKIPLSVKTRIGFNEVDLSWIEFLLSQKINALTVHFRTKKEMSKVSAHWELAEEISKMRNNLNPKIILVGNGDIKSLKEGRDRIRESGFDGVMIGRGIFDNPLLFAEKEFAELSIKDKLKIAKKHTKYFDQEFPENREGKRIKNFALLKKFFKIYINGFEGAKELRGKLMNAKDKKEIFDLIDEFINKKYN